MEIKRGDIFYNTTTNTYYEEQDGSNCYECEDAVSREAVLEGLANIAKAKAKSDAQKSMMGRCMFFVEQLPPVTPQRQKGKWIEYKVDIASHPLHCSLCGFSNLHIGNRYMREFRCCPNCGAEMEIL